MINKPNKTQVINHRLGKIVLNSIGTNECSLRVRLKSSGELETVGRALGGAWDASSVNAHPQFLHALKEHLMRIGNGEYWYIQRFNVDVVSKRFATVKQPTKA